jgi:hypothetical protein
LHCNLRNASTLINGVRFASVPDGMVSEEVSDEVAEAFTAITGYTIHGTPHPERPEVAARRAKKKPHALLTEPKSLLPPPTARHPHSTNGRDDGVMDDGAAREL